MVKSVDEKQKKQVGARKKQREHIHVRRKKRKQVDVQKKQRKQVNVRLSDEVFDQVLELAEDKNMSRSAVVSQAIMGELSRMAEQPVNSLTDEERGDILIKLGAILTTISKIESRVSNISNNYNQVTRLLNRDNDLSDQNIDVVRKYSDEVYDLRQLSSSELMSNKDVLMKIWRILV